MNTLAIQTERREVIGRIETAIRTAPGSMEGDCFPLKHTFTDGMYIREISCPKGALVVTKTHKVCHPYFLLKGECSVLTEEGVKRIKAPYSGITPAGTKRVVFCHEDVVWTTCHATKETDLEKIEQEVIANNFDEVDGFIDTGIADFVKEIVEEK